MQLQQLTRPELIAPVLPGFDSPTVLRALAQILSDQVEAITDRQRLYEKLSERERLASTGVGKGVAVPHCKLRGLDQLIMAIGITASGIEFSAVDGQPVRLFFAVVSPEDRPAEHLQCLAAISRWITAERVEQLLTMDSAAEIYAALDDRASG